MAGIKLGPFFGEWRNWYAQILYSNRLGLWYQTIHKGVYNMCDATLDLESKITTKQRFFGLIALYTQKQQQ